MSFLQFKESSFIGTRYVHACNIKVKMLGLVVVVRQFSEAGMEVLEF